MTVTSTSEAPPSFLIRILLPSGADLVFIVLLFSLSMGVLAPRLLGDAGIGWHIRNGELILQNHAVTRIDPFSSTMAGHPWYAWEWLFDVIVAGIHGRLALSGVVLLGAGLIALTFAVVLRLAVLLGASLPVAAVLVALAAGASTIHYFARPHVLSWLLTALWFWILDSSERGPSSKRLYWLPFLMVLWVNLHGGFVLGFVLLGIYLLAAMWEKVPQRWRTLGIVSVLCVVASFVNPYGYQLHAHVYRYLTDRFLMDHIDEFLSPNFHGIAQQSFAALLLLGMVAVAVRRDKIRPSHLMVLLFAAYSGLFASRNLPVSSILLTFVAGPMLSQTISEYEGPSFASRILQRLGPFSARMTRMELRAGGCFWSAIVFLALLWSCWHGRLIHAGFDGNRFPLQAVDYVAQQKIGQPIFCPDYWGGFLIYRLYPQNKVVADDRHDLYGDAFLQKYLKTIHVEPGWNELLEEYNVRWALLPTDSSLANMLQMSRNWKVQFKDGTGILFERTSAK